MTSKTSENESLIGFHLIRKSANALASDLRYFKEVPSNFSDSQIANILGEIEEVEEYIKIIRQSLSKKVL